MRAFIYLAIITLTTFSGVASSQIFLGLESPSAGPINENAGLALAGVDLSETTDVISYRWEYGRPNTRTTAVAQPISIVLPLISYSPYFAQMVSSGEVISGSLRIFGVEEGQTQIVERYRINFQSARVLSIKPFVSDQQGQITYAEEIKILPTEVLITHVPSNNEVPLTFVAQ